MQEDVAQLVRIADGGRFKSESRVQFTTTSIVAAGISPLSSEVCVR